MAGDAVNLVVGGATVGIGAYGGAAADIGYIKGGITQTPTTDLFFIDGIEQLNVDPEGWITHRNFEFTFTLIEPTLDNLIYAWDLPDATAGGGTVAETLDILTTISFEPTTLEVAFTGVVPGAGRYVRTVTYWKAIVVTPAPVVFTKGQETNLEVTMKGLYDHVTEEMVALWSDAIA